MKTSGKILMAAALAALAGCGGEQAGERVTLGQPPASAAALTPEVRAALDSGTVAYRAGDYAQALAYYRRAVESAPDQPAPWLGVSMAERALGNVAAADSAASRAQALAPGVIMSHPDPAEGGMPTGHPPVTGGDSGEGAAASSPAGKAGQPE